MNEQTTTEAHTLQCALVMPAYNEQDCIEQVVAAWRDELRRQVGDSFRLVVVDDGSRDRTGAILDGMAKNEPRLLAIHQPNAGHGAALMHGYREALALAPEYVFQTDSDDQFLPSDFEKLWQQRASSAFILGFRETRHDAPHRLVITRILRLLVLLVFGVRVKDANIPYRLIRADYLRKLLAVLPPDLFAPNIFLSILAAREGQDLNNIPVTHRDRQTGTVSIIRWRLIRVCLRSAMELIRFRAGLDRAVRSIRQGERAR